VKGSEGLRGETRVQAKADVCDQVRLMIVKMEAGPDGAVLKRIAQVE
jgi:hypothetical protein